MDKLAMQTPDRTQENIEHIARLFPSVVTEAEDENGNIKKAIDFDLLRQQLSEVLVEDDSERYRLDWPGKKASLLKANTPITKTLRPCREESVNFDTTENLYLEGDNFEVLKILQESYLGKIKMIYIDPPYNTGNDFIYKDDFRQSREEYEEELGVVDEEGGRLFRNTDSNGRFHSDWLSMMYERLVVARDLLRDDGVIFISIDDGEVASLRKLCDEIFGEDNFIASIVWQKRTSPDARYNLGSAHDHIAVYSRSIETAKVTLAKLPISEERKASYKNPDNDPRGAWASVDMTGQTGHATPSQFYAVTTSSGKQYPPPDGRCWALAESTFKRLVEEGRIWFGANGDARPRIKRYLSETEGVNCWTWWPNTEVGHNQEATKEVKELLKVGAVFDNPKPIRLIQRILHIGMGANDTSLDFFSGSATTAHAVMQLNAEDGGNRKFIMVQLPEETDESSEAYKAGYKTIADIGKERIRRAGKKILQELKEKNQQTKLGEESFDPDKLDIGFRVYKTDTTNMKDVFYHPNDLTQAQLEAFQSNIKEDRTPEDLLTQVILDLGLELSLPIEQKKMHGNTVFIVQTNALVACFDNDINFRIIDEIADLQPLKVVFKDASLADDKDRINVEERFKRLSPETRITVL